MSHKLQYLPFCCRFLRDSGLELTDGGHVRCDDRLEAAGGGGRVLVAGDIAAFPLRCAGGQEVRTE